MVIKHAGQSAWVQIPKADSSWDKSRKHSGLQILHL